MELNQCPHDGSAIEAEMCSGGSLLLVCPECGAEWETHGAWVRDLREPANDAPTATATRP
jgi:hypothetical protein